MKQTINNKLTIKQTSNLMQKAVVIVEKYINLVISTTQPIYFAIYLR